MKALLTKIRRILARKRLTRPYHEQLDFDHILK